MTITGIRTLFSNSVASVTEIKTFSSEYLSYINAKNNSDLPIFFLLRPSFHEKHHYGIDVHKDIWDIRFLVANIREQKKESDLDTLLTTLEGYGDSVITKLLTSSDVIDITSKIKVEYPQGISNNDLVGALFSFTLETLNCPSS